MTTHLRHLCGLGLLLAAASAQAANVPISLWARSGTTDLPGAPATPVLGYVQDSATPVTGPGGPVLRVRVGDVVTITLTNDLGESTAILFQGQGMVPDTVGAPPAGGTRIYTFTASNPGTFLYEAALLPSSERQAAMGLSGAFVVEPVVPVGAPAQAYGPATVFDADAVLVLSEIDAGLNANPATFDMRNFKPQYFLVNGKPYPNTAPIQVLPGQKVLLRFVNAGQQNHSMTVLGMQQTLVGKDGSAIAYPSSRAAETIAPGETLDAIATVPGTTVAGTRFALFDGNLALHNSSLPGYGGMLAFLQAGTPGGGGGDVIGPATTGVALTPSFVDASGGSVIVAASVSDAASGNSNVAGAEYFVDTVGALGSGASMGGPFGSPVVAVSATIPAGTLATGNHSVYVRGRDSVGNWGAVASAVLAVDRSGPTTSGLALAPAPTNGTAAVALSGTADDQASGGANILAAEYFIDTTGATGGGSAMAVAPAGTATVASLSASIAAATVGALPEGSHAIHVHAQDTRLNWGAFASKALVVDRTGPSATSLAATPGATNGTKGLSASQPVVRITTAAVDGLAGGVSSSIAGAEGFLDTVGVTGSGFVFLPTDGSWSATSENAFGDVPLTALATLREENHPVHVHARDAAGNWGPTSSVNVLVDRTPPVLTGATLSFNPAAGYIGTPVVMTVNGASDPPPASAGNGPPSGVAGGEYWLGTTAPAPGGGTAFTGNGASIPTSSLAAGTYTVGVRVRDAAGNWSTSSISGTFSVARNDIFADGFESGTTNAWSSRSTGSATRLNVTAAAALVGAFGLQAQGNNTNYVQYNFGTAANPAAATFDARFHFRPNGNTSTGKDVFAAATTSTFGTTLFRVRYRLAGSTPQVQIQVGTTNANTTWTNVLGGASSNVIEVVRQAAGSGGPNPGTLVLYVNGVAAQTLATTSTASVAAFRLGSVTSVGSTQVMYFDQFASKRLTTPLWGP